MPYNVGVPNAHAWISQIFASRSANTGGIVRRSVKSVVEFASVELLQDEVKKRGYHMVESGDQFVIFCHTGNLKIVA